MPLAALSASALAFESVHHCNGGGRDFVVITRFDGEAGHTASRVDRVVCALQHPDAARLKCSGGVMVELPI